jgi:glycosyltransferase involved in cell wall biosynthesis
MKIPPKISIITPSFNQVNFIEKTIDSVLSQGHPNLEYLIVDGGSNDGSLEIIRKYDKYLSWWVSEPDQGQAHALNKALKRVTGEWVGWQNSDDYYLPGALNAASEIQSTVSEKIGVIAGAMLMVNSLGEPIRELRYVKPTFRSLRAEGMVIANQSTWWRRSLHEKLGFLDEKYNCSFDFDWFLRLLKNTDAYYIDDLLGALRLHDGTKTNNLTKEFTIQNRLILEHWGFPSFLERKAFQIRRGLLTLRGGHIKYFINGLFSRAKLIP